jgi:hypothetical protein
VRRYWLHQANLGMNQLVIRKLVGGEVDDEIAPLILDEYANTASAGSIIAFHHHHADMAARRPRRDLLVRRGLLGGQRGGAALVSPLQPGRILAAPLPFASKPASRGFASAAMPGYQTKQEHVAIAGVDDLVMLHNLRLNDLGADEIPAR